MLTEIYAKFPFNHKALCCYLAMSVWVFFLITANYKFISLRQDKGSSKIDHKGYTLSKMDTHYRKIISNVCNPPENIVRGTEAGINESSWMLYGVLLLTRHGDRGPLTHLKKGDKIPCDAVHDSPLLKSYESFVRNISGGALRGPWAAAPGPFHNFPTLPANNTATRCPLGQLTNVGLLQMLRIGEIMYEAYAEKLNLLADNLPKDSVVTYSTRYRRTYQSLLGVVWGSLGGSVGGASGAVGGAGGTVGGAVGGRRAATVAARARESHSLAYCFTDCACPALAELDRKISGQTRSRFESHPSMKDLVTSLTNVMFESHQNSDPEVVRDALLAYMCHDHPLPCTEKRTKTAANVGHRRRKLHSLAEDQHDYNIDFNSAIGVKAMNIKDRIDHASAAVPYDFDAQMEKEKLQYYQQRYSDNADDYGDVEVVKKNLDADFNFPDSKFDVEFDEDYKERTPEAAEDFCVKSDHVVNIFSYLQKSYIDDTMNVNVRKRGLLQAYGLVYNIVQNMIRMISENKPKFVIYSGHDKTLQPLMLALGLSYIAPSQNYASRVIFEVYRRRDLKGRTTIVAQDFYFRVVYNGLDVTNNLSFCHNKHIIVEQPNKYLCPLENIVRFIHDDYFGIFNASNFKDACASRKSGRRRG